MVLHDHDHTHTEDFQHWSSSLKSVGLLRHEEEIQEEGHTGVHADSMELQRAHRWRNSFAEELGMRNFHSGRTLRLHLAAGIQCIESARRAAVRSTQRATQNCSAW